MNASGTASASLARDKGKSEIGKTATHGDRLRKTALTAALLAIYGYAPGAGAVNLTIETPTDLGASVMTNSTVTVNAGGVVTGDGTTVSGSAYEMVLVNSGGSLSLDNATLSNNLDSPTGQNGRTITAKGAGATVSLTNSTLSISAQSTNAGADYAHAFTAAVGATNGGHVDIRGGSISASGSKRTVGIQANDGGSISASDVQITTNGNFGHAVNVYRTPSASEQATHIDLDHVSITTHGANYAVGIQSANKGASVTAIDTDITTQGAISFGVETFNGATALLTNGSITTSGAGAAGVRVYGGSLGSGAVTVQGTTIATSGASASGILAGDAAEPTAGTASLVGANITTTGSNAAGLESAFGSDITSTTSSVHTQGSASHGVYAHDGGSITLGADTVTTDGYQSYGIDATGSGASVTATGASIATSGLYGFGARAEAGGAISLDGGSITTNNATGRDVQDGDGSRAYALSADGVGSRISTRNGTVITTQGQRAYGAYATNGGHISLNDASVTTHGFMAYGLYARDAGSTVDATNVVLTTSGSVGDGVWAYQGGVVNLDGGSVTVGGEPNVNSPHETANGLVAVGGDSVFAPGTINATGVTVVTQGANSAGVLAGSTVGTSFTTGAVNLTNASVTVQGSHAIAASVNYGSSLTANGSTLVSQNGDGIVMTDNATVNLVGTSVQAAGASLVSNLDRAGQKQEISVGAGSALTVNNGTLLQVNRSEAGMDGIVDLTLQAGSIARGDVIDLDGLSTDSTTRSQGGKTNFTVAAGASWVGIVRGINDVTAGDGGSLVDNGGAPIQGNVTGGPSSTITFNHGAEIGGTVSVAAASQATFNGATSIGGNVTATDATLSFNGATTINQSVNAEQTQITFAASTTVNQSVTGGSGSTIAFNGAASVAQNVTGGAGTAYTFAGATTIGQSVVGSGTSFEFSKGLQTTIGGDVTLNDNASLQGGTTATPIVIGGDAIVSSGATLGGNLYVQGSLNGAGGNISPGNSVGTQSYASIASFGSTYKAEVNAAGKSDLVIARTGDVDLSSTHLTVAQENGNGGYLLHHDYTIVQTVDGVVKNQFASTQLDDSFANTLVTLDPVKYASKEVSVSLSVDAAKVAAARRGLSFNQSQTLDGALSVAGENAAAAAAMTSTDTKGSLNQLSGEVHASTLSAMINSSHLVRNTMSDRLRGNAGAGIPASTSPLWAQVVGERRTLDGDNNAASAKSDVGGLFLGGDTQVGQGWRIGAALGYTDGDTKVADRSSQADVKSYTAAVYGGNSWDTGKGSLDLLLGAAYTRHAIDTSRSVTLGGNQALKADYHAHGTQLFSELGHAFPVGDASSFGPYLGLAWLKQSVDGFDESGGAAALRSAGQTDDVTTATVGVRGKTAFTVGAQKATLTGGIGWRHAAGDIDPRRQMSFSQGDSASFSIAGTPIAKDAALVSVGAEMALGKNATVGLSYIGEFGGGSRYGSASLYLKAAF
ncbi:MAG TPA: autotransporter domain-containing protein [Variovorax sp.]